MKILFISNDKVVTDMHNEVKQDPLNQIIVLNKNPDPLNVMSTTCRIKPSILLIDDDFLKPNTAHILKSIKEVIRNVSVIFITSNIGIELGREVSQIGIQYYAIKPLSRTDIKDAIYSIQKLQKKTTNQSIIN